MGSVLKMPPAPHGDPSSRQRNRRVRCGWSSFDRAWGAHPIRGWQNRASGMRSAAHLLASWEASWSSLVWTIKVGTRQAECGDRHTRSKCPEE